MAEYVLQPSPRANTSGVSAAGVSGSWTPTFSFNTPGDLSIVYGQQVGTYTRQVDYVTAWFRVEMSTFTHTTASGGAFMSGLPYKALSLSSGGSVTIATGSCYFQGITAAGYTQLTPALYHGFSLMEFLLSGSGQTSTILDAPHMPTGGTPLLIGTVMYRAEPLAGR